MNASQLSSYHKECEVAQLYEEPEGDSLTSNTRQYNLQESAGHVYHNSTNERQTKYNGRNLENIETQQARLIPRESLGNVRFFSCYLLFNKYSHYYRRFASRQIFVLIMEK